MNVQILNVDKINSSAHIREVQSKSFQLKHKKIKLFDKLWVLGITYYIYSFLSGYNRRELEIFRDIYFCRGLEIFLVGPSFSEDCKIVTKETNLKFSSPRDAELRHNLEHFSYPILFLEFQVLFLT